MSKEVAKLECPWLKEVGVKEVCDFEKMFSRRPKREDCLNCLASSVEIERSKSRISKESEEELRSILLMHPEKMLAIIATLRDHPMITTTELMEVARLPFSKTVELLHLLPVQAIRRAKGYRWRLVRADSTKEAQTKEKEDC